MDVNEGQVGGTHYKSKYQHWDFVADCLQGRYLEGCITKYLTRWRQKNGLEDLKKALHYMDKLIDSAYKSNSVHQAVCMPLMDQRRLFSDPNLQQFLSANAVPTREAVIITLIATWSDVIHLQICHQLIQLLIADEMNGRGEKMAAACCSRDHDGDGNCDRHRSLLQILPASPSDTN